MKHIIILLIFLYSVSALYAQRPKLKRPSEKELNERIICSFDNKKNKYGYVNEKGKYIIKPVFDYATDFNQWNLAFVAYDGGKKYTVIDRDMCYVYDFDIDSIVKSPANSPYILFHSGDRMGALSKDFDLEIDPEWKNIALYSAAASLGKEYALVMTDTVGKKSFYENIGGTGVYDDIRYSDESGCFILKRDDLYGFIPKGFGFLCEPRFKVVPPLHTQLSRFYDDISNEALFVSKTQIYTVMEYDSLLHKKLNEEDYSNTKELPSWMKSYLWQDIKEKRLLKEHKCSGVPYNRINSANLYYSNGSGDGYVKFPSVVKENVGSDEYWHEIIGHSWYVNKTMCIARDYRTEDLFLVLSSFQEKFDDKGKSTINTISKNEACCIQWEYVKKIIADHEKKSIGYMNPIQFAVLDNGNVILTMKIIGSSIDRYGGEHDYEFECALILNSDGYIVKYLHLPDRRQNQILVDKEGGFFCIGWDEYNNVNMEYELGMRNINIRISEESPLSKFSDGGEFEWKYTPSDGQRFYDIDGSDDRLFLVGSTTSQGIIGHNNDILVTLSNSGCVMSQSVRKDSDYNERVKVYRGGLYVTDTNDGILQCIRYVYSPYLRCQWQKWGNGTVGGCGLYADCIGWIIPPVLPGSKPKEREGWTIYPFDGDKAKVINDETIMYVDRDSKIVH